MSASDTSRVRVKTSAPLPELQAWLSFKPSSSILQLKKSVLALLDKPKSITYKDIVLEVDSFAFLDQSQCSVIDTRDIIIVKIKPSANAANSKVNKPISQKKRSRESFETDPKESATRALQQAKTSSTASNLARPIPVDSSRNKKARIDSGSQNNSQTNLKEIPSSTFGSTHYAAIQSQQNSSASFKRSKRSARKKKKCGKGLQTTQNSHLQTSSKGSKAAQGKQSSQPQRNAIVVPPFRYFNIDLSIPNQNKPTQPSKILKSPTRQFTSEKMGPWISTDSLGKPLPQNPEAIKLGLPGQGTDRTKSRNQRKRLRKQKISREKVVSSAPAQLGDFVSLENNIHQSLNPHQALVRQHKKVDILQNQKGKPRPSGSNISEAKESSRTNVSISKSNSSGSRSMASSSAPVQSPALIQSTTQITPNNDESKGEISPDSELSTPSSAPRKKLIIAQSGTRTSEQSSSESSSSDSESTAPSLAPIKKPSIVQMGTKTQEKPKCKSSESESSSPSSASTVEDSGSETSSDFESTTPSSTSIRNPTTAKIGTRTAKGSECVLAASDLKASTPISLVPLYIPIEKNVPDQAATQIVQRTVPTLLDPKLNMLSLSNKNKRKNVKRNSNPSGQLPFSKIVFESPSGFHRKPPSPSYTPLSPNISYSSLYSSRSECCHTLDSISEPKDKVYQSSQEVGFTGKHGPPPSMRCADLIPPNVLITAIDILDPNWQPGQAGEDWTPSVKIKKSRKKQDCNQKNTTMLKKRAHTGLNLDSGSECHRINEHRNHNEFDTVNDVEKAYAEFLSSGGHNLKLKDGGSIDQFEAMKDHWEKYPKLGKEEINVGDRIGIRVVEISLDTLTPESLIYYGKVVKLDIESITIRLDSSCLPKTILNDNQSNYCIEDEPNFFEEIGDLEYKEAMRESLRDCVKADSWDKVIENQRQWNWNSINEIRNIL
ncbi:hypothetical protein BY996DRAFT_7059579 [Phakopsora pachyrhizi]|uniref:Expressed protein n=1 Tax=Phakopsora pachyrhizi TaxID=170000 RepID=A0AAV0B369_PHAPC|nr:hypothetical protein BY996DRAFT_7059579 [Phakopsora pachyrhizi]CAH7676933.1 expressed protein [Phakopsora pachyrhizi]